MVNRSREREGGRKRERERGREKKKGRRNEIELTGVDAMARVEIQFFERNISSHLDAVPYFVSALVDMEENCAIWKTR